MPMSPDDIGAVVAALVTGVAGGIGAVKLQSKHTPAPSGDPTLEAIEKLALKVDSVSRQVYQVKLSVDGLKQEIDDAAHALNELRPVVADLRVRVAGLESRMPSKLPGL